MRVILCFVLLLSACAAHDVRCDGRLRPINQPERAHGPAGRAAPVPPGNAP